MGAIPSTTGTIAQRYGSREKNYSALTPQQSPHERLVSNAKQLYPFINNSNPVLIPSQKQGGEAWPVGETGAPDYPRPSSIPIDRHGIEVGPGSTEADIAGEVLHIDPFAQATRDKLKSSLTPQQTAYLKTQSLDYGDGPSKDASEEDHRMNNAVDAAIRGKLVGQWPAKANDGMNYSPEQQGMLDQLQQYMTTGKQQQPSNAAPRYRTPQ